MSHNIQQKISYRVSLIWIINLLLGLIFLAFFLQGYFNFKLIKQQQIETEIIQKETLAETMAEIIQLPTNFDILKHRIDELNQLPGMQNLVYFRVIRPSGDIFCSTFTQEIGRQIENFQAPKQTLIEDATFQGKKVKTITASSQLSGTAIQLGFSIQDITETKQALIRFLVSDILFFFVIALCFFVLFKIIVRPVEQLTGLCNQIRQGVLITKPIETDIQEINDLTVAFNKMISDLAKYKNELERANQLLETKVKERTKELENLTANLEEKVEQRTKQLQEKIEELKKFERLSIGRELKMIEQKKEIAALKNKLENLEKNNQ